MDLIGSLSPADKFVLTRDEVRSIDAAAVEGLGIHGLVLMENAARGVADHLTGVRPDGSVVIVCGPGNNGGDGLALARQRAAQGLSSRILLVTNGKSLTPDAQANLDSLLRSGVAVERNHAAGECERALKGLTEQDWIVDCLLGTGIRGAVREPFCSWIADINESPARVLAVDLPSGLDTDTGLAASECIRADLTVTFVGLKRGFLNPEAAEWTGRVVVEHIGIPKPWIASWLQQRRDS